MAIHKDIPGIEVTINVGGSSLVEYVDANDEINHENQEVRLHHINCTIANYVECTTGAQFSIKTAIDSKYKWDSPRVGLDVYVDGVRAVGACPSRAHYKNINWIWFVEGIQSGSSGKVGVLQRFKFSKIHTTSDIVDMARVQEEKVRFSKIGEIMVKVYRLGTRILKARVHKKPNRLGNSYENTVPEEALKGEAKSHGITLEDNEQTRLPNVLRCETLDGKDYPIAIFKFKYRSNDALKQLRIIEHTPKHEDQDILSGLTAEEKRDVLEFVRNRKRKRETDYTVKQEYAHSEPKVEDKKKLRSIEPSRIVDLTGD